jgi:hypothetical protein
VACGLALFLARAHGEADPGAFESDRSLRDTLGMSGSVRAADFSKDKSFKDQTGYTVASVWASAAPQEFWGIKTYFDGRVQAQDLTRGSGTAWELREAYAQISIGKLDIRVGRQITVWGRADKVNPTDSWSTRDFTLLAPEDDDQRLGIAALQATWNAGAYRAIALWQPEWRDPVSPIPPLPPGLSVRNIAPSDPPRQWGIKLDHSGKGVDWSISLSRSIDRTPDISVLPGRSQGLALGLVYHPVTVVGADAAVPIGQYGLRAEVAYTRTQDRDGTDPLTQNRNVFAVVGVERTFYGVLNINAQTLYRRTFDFVPLPLIHNPNSQLLAAQVDLLSNQLASDMYGASLRINYKAWNETLESEVAAVGWVKKGDSAILPKVTYAFTDHWKGIVGGEIYHGPPQSFFGRLNRTSTAYVEFRLGF